MLNVYGRRLFAWLGCVVVLLVGAGVSLAIQPVTVVHETEADFSDGTTESARVTTRGRIALAPETADVIELGEDLTTLFGALRLADEEAWLLAAGPKGLFLGRAERGAVAVEGVADEEQVFVITRVGERVVVGISGETSRLAVYSEGAVTTVMALPGVRYIWEVVDLGRGMVAVATGTEGKVLVAMLDAPEREPRVALETGQANVLSLVVGADGETLFAGTDGEGLVYRVRIVEGEPEVYVMYDAPEPEIASLVVTTDGSLLVGTADSEQARPGRLEEPVASSEGALEAVEEAAEEVDPMLESIEGAEPVAAETGEAAAGDDEVDMAVEAGGEASEEQPAVTDEQRDRLREVLRERLMAARERGELQVSGIGEDPRQMRAPAAQRVRPAQPRGGGGEGNAVYVITEGGFVRELFRESVTMLGLVERADFIVVGTGNEGQVYAIDEETLEVSVLADFESEQVSVLEAAGPDGLLVGLSNPARLVSMSEGLTRRGVFVSGVIDAEQISLWGTARLRVDLPAGSSVTFETRSSNLGDPELAGWSSWSNPLGLMSHDSVAPEIPREVTVTSPPARFLQYRITLMSDGAASPEVDAVMVTHVTPNLQPRLLSVSVDVEEVSDPDVTPGAEYGVNWEAEDPNGDRLRYEVSFQRAGSSVWIVAEEELEENRFGWDTARVPDGWYRVRVTADDKLDNPPDMARFARRVSDPVLVDRTPPVIEGLAHRVMPGGRVRVSGVVVDELSAILSIGYAIDGEVSFRPIIPEDLILDSTREAFSITLQGLTQPEHVVTLRVVDRRGQSRLIPLVVDTTDF